MSRVKWYTVLILLHFLLPGSAATADLGEVQATPPPEPALLETGLLEATPGYVGDVLGAEVESTSSSGAQTDVIVISIPINPDQVDEVRVISPVGKVIKQSRPAEIERDYEHNNVGIRLYLPKQKKWEFKLRLVDQTGEY